MTTGPPPQAPLLPPTGLLGLTLRGMVLLVQFMFLLLAVDNSPVFGGGWSSYVLPFEVYILIFGGAVIIEGTIAPVGKSGVKVVVPEDERPNFALDFALWCGVFLLIGTVGGAFLIHFFATTTAPLTGQAQITTIAYVLVFVAPTEEFLFRVVLPQRVGWPLGAVVLFGLFHFGAYAAQNGAFNTNALGQIIFAMALGWILYIIYNIRTHKGYRMFGYGGCDGAHAAFDLVQLGAVAPFTLAVVWVGPLLH